MIVEYEEELAEILSTYLSDHGYNCCTLSRPGSDVADRDLSKMSTVILDWNSVVRSYEQWLPKLKSLPYKTRCIWTFSNDEDVRSCPHLFDDQILLVKPFSLDKLVEYLEAPQSIDLHQNFIKKS